MGDVDGSQETGKVVGRPGHPKIIISGEDRDTCFLCRTFQMKNRKYVGSRSSPKSCPLALKRADSLGLQDAGLVEE